MDLTQHANSAYIWLQRTDWWRVQKYLFNTSYVATLTWAGDGEGDHRDAPRGSALLIYVCGETSPGPQGTGGPQWRRGMAVPGGLWRWQWWRVRRGEDKKEAWRLPGPGLGGEPTVYSRAGRPQQASTEHPAGSSAGEGGRGCPETKACMEMVGAGGAWLGEAIGALNVVVSSLLAFVTLLSLSCSAVPVRLVQAWIYLPRLGLSTLSQTQNVCLSLVWKNPSVIHALSITPFPQPLSSLLQNSLLNANWVFLI